MVTEVREVQPLKQSSPRLVTEEGTLTEVREVQFSKQYHPRLVTDDGMSIEVREVHSSKQESPRLVTLYVTPSCATFFGMTTSFAEPL